MGRSQRLVTETVTRRRPTLMAIGGPVTGTTSPGVTARSASTLGSDFSCQHRPLGHHSHYVINEQLIMLSQGRSLCHQGQVIMLPHGRSLCHQGQVIVSSGAVHYVIRGRSLCHQGQVIMSSRISSLCHQGAAHYVIRGYSTVIRGQVIISPGDRSLFHPRDIIRGLVILFSGG